MGRGGGREGMGRGRGDGKGRRREGTGRGGDGTRPHPFAPPHIPPARHLLLLAALMPAPSALALP